MLVVISLKSGGNLHYAWFGETWLLTNDTDFFISKNRFVLKNGQTFCFQIIVSLYC
jgi:hypothetical protein